PINYPDTVMPTPRVPTHLKLIRGNPGKRPLNKREPQPKGLLSEAPDWLTPDQKAGWDYALTHAPLGLLRKLDRSILAVWVVAESLHAEANQKVRALGLIVKAPGGAPIQNPFLPIINKQALIMLRAANELGFSPAARTRIQMPDDSQAAPQEDEFFS